MPPLRAITNFQLYLKDIEFEGERVAAVSGGEELGRVEIYKTAGGRWVVNQLPSGLRGGPALRVEVLGTLDDLLGWIGYSKQAKQLAETVGVSTTEKIE